MDNFITVYEKIGYSNVRSPVLINPSKIEKIVCKGKQGTTIYFNQHGTDTIEPFHEIIKLIKENDEWNQSLIKKNKEGIMIC